jgi:2'-5' RNA ligase
VWRATIPLRAAAPSIAWVREDLFHFTIKFLGECTAAQSDQIRGAVDRVTARHAPLTWQLQGAGAFPNFRRPRVVWIGTANASAMERLTREVDEAMQLLGFPPDTRAFTAHLTIGRVKRELDRHQGVALERAAQAVDLAASASAASVDLMSSELSRSGPTYQVVARCALLAGDTAVARGHRSAY